MNSKDENFHYGESFQKQETYVLRTSIYIYENKKSGKFLCAKIWENFQAPHKQHFISSCNDIFHTKTLNLADV